MEKALQFTILLLCSAQKSDLLLADVTAVSGAWTSPDLEVAMVSKDKPRSALTEACITSPGKEQTSMKPSASNQSVDLLAGAVADIELDSQSAVIAPATPSPGRGKLLFLVFLDQQMISRA